MQTYLVTYVLVEFQVDLLICVEDPDHNIKQLCHFPHFLSKDWIYDQWRQDVFSVQQKLLCVVA